MEGMSSIFMLVVMFAVMYLLLIRPEKKRKQKAQEMRDSIKKGDVITTIGGIIGKVVFVNKDSVVVETGDDRVRIELAKWAVSSVGVQSSEQPVEAKSKKGKKDEPVAVPEEPAAPEASAETSEEA